MLSVLCSEKTELFDPRLGIEHLDVHVRASIEALVLHTWYVDLWDCRADDSSAWSPRTLKSIVAFVERDRQVISASPGNRQVSKKCLLLLPMLC